MSKVPVYISLTMDCERLAEHAPCGGPATWDIAETSARGYADQCEAAGFPVTFFVHPETAQAQTALFTEMAQRGHECGMHLHPQSWRDHYLHPDAYDYLGGYTYNEQCDMLGQAREEWQQVMGFAPMAFRSGNVSANDETFRAIETIGFHVSSCSQPNRCVPAYRAVWTGADRTIHRAHRAFRLVTGDLELVEVPITVDVKRSDHWTGVGDVRFENSTADEILQAIEQELQWQAECGSALRHICLFTHNCMGYRPENAEWTYYCYPVLMAVLAGLPSLAERLQVEWRGATLTRIREAFLHAV